MGQFMSEAKNKLILCAEKYIDQGNEVDRRHLLLYLQTYEYRKTVSAAQDESALANAFSQSCTLNHVDLVKAFLENGINVEIKNATRFTALTSASSCGSKESVRLLFGHSANVNVQTDGGWTPLMFASMNGEMKIVEMLLENHADVNIQSKHGFTALIVGCQNGRGKIVQLLLDHNADVSLNKDGEIAFYLGELEEIKEMIRNHVNNNNNRYVLK